MPMYANRGGDSGIVSYETGDDWIRVVFNDKSKYKYNYESTGQTDIEKMKALADAGEGLNEFIKRHVKERYACKSR